MILISRFRLIFVFLILFLLYGCANPTDEPLNVVYEGKSVSFKLEEFEEDWEHLSGMANGSGFIQASGEIDDVFSHIFKNNQFESKPKWQGRYFKLTINYTGDKVEDEILNKVIEEIQRNKQISVNREQKTTLGKCLEIEDPNELHLNIFESNSGEAESTSLTNGILRLKGYNLQKLANYLSNIKSSIKYLYNGTDTNVYQFELNVADEKGLSHDLLSYGINLTECDVVHTVTIFD